MAAGSNNNQNRVLEEALKRYVDAYLRGEQPNTEEFIKQYPECEDLLRQRIRDLLKINTLFGTLVQIDESDFDERGTEHDLVGQKVGNFEIVEMIGRGGMGVVYRAHDTKLDRFVAIKSMPAELQANSTAQSRFRREAKLLASLSHPNIAVIHEIIEQDEGADYLILEYVPGETLAEQIAKGPLHLQDALSTALQIAKAVSAAHEHDIIHRDLKPGNIKITPDGTVKVLDFGLAKAVEGKAANQQSTVTEPGRAIGTPAYMSPEQARGQSTDKRSDIWSFGCVLYEMLTGKAPFESETVSDTLANVLQTDPDWQALPKVTPANIRILIRRCLEKDSNHRLHDITDARIEISETLSGTLEAFTLTGEAAEVPHFSRRNVIIVGVVCFIVGMLIIGTILKTFMQPSPSASRIVERLSISIPADKPLYLKSSPNCSLALSPDGTRLVYVAELVNDRTTQLYKRSIDKLKVEPIPGTRGAHNPFFSPDGKWIGFFTKTSELKKVFFSEGKPLILLENIPWSGIKFGSWAEDGTIIFNSGGSLQQISADGGKPEILVEDSQAIYQYPQVLPTGKGILCVKGSRIEVLLPQTGERQTVFDDATYAQYVRSGHLIFLRNSVLMVAPFDIERFKVTGHSVPLVDQIRLDWGFRTPQIAISHAGNIVYVSGPEFGNKTLVWVDRQGLAEPFEVLAPYYFTPRLSPDGQRIAVTVMSSEGFHPQVYIYDILRGALTPFTTEGKNSYPQWSPDGKRLAFSSTRSEGSGVYWKVIEGSAPPELLAAGKPSLLPCSWSRDGKFLACTARDPNTQDDIWILPLDDDRKPKPFLRTQYREYNPMLSPDNRWLAYASNETGDMQIYLLEYPDRGRKIPVSTEGGKAPVWSPDGRELYYTSASTLMVVQITPEPDFGIGTPKRLFEGSYNMGGNLGHGYDVSLDGSRFLMIKKSDDPEVQLIHVQNWFEELKKLAPPGKD